VDPGAMRLAAVGEFGLQGVDERRAERNRLRFSCPHTARWRRHTSTKLAVGDGAFTKPSNNEGVENLLKAGASTAACARRGLIELGSGRR